MGKQNISKKILHWYDNNKRILPWRKDVSKKQKQYFTLVSEFMLQQTQVKTVIPYFKNFIKKIPNLKKLSKVNDKKLMKCWEGLGYYSRARNLKKTAKKVVSDFRGSLPKNIDDLKTLPGIGEYTSRAIMAIAFNKPIIDFIKKSKANEYDRWIPPNIEYSRAFVDKLENLESVINVKI